MLKSRFRPRLEPLESRRMLATLVVTSAADNLATDGELTLREAIVAANANISVDGSVAGDPGSDTIEFAPALGGQTIDLALGEIQVSESISIVGLGADRSVIDAGNQSRIFRFTDSSGPQFFSVQGLSLQNGVAPVFIPSGDSFGGAIYLNSASRSRLLIRDSHLVANQATIGGAISVSRAILHIDGSSISGNSADFGGGISVQESNSTLTNTTVSDNTADVIGGGIDHFTHDPNQSSTLDLIHVTVMDNEAPQGRNIRSGTKGGDAVLRYANSIIFGQSNVSELLAGPPDGSGSATAVSLGGNLTDHSVASANLTPQDRRVLSFEGNIGPLSDNGGTVPTRALHPLDFAVDLGLNDGAVGPGPDLLMGTADDVALSTDQRGGTFHRSVDGGSGTATVDAGAFEIQVGIDVPDHLVVNNTIDVLFRGDGPDLSDLTLREAIHLSNLRIGPNSISFDDALFGETIRLTSGRTLFVYDDLDLIGPGADKLTIDGDNQNRQFVFQANEDIGLRFLIQGLTLTGGKSPSSGGAIFALRNRLVVKDCHFEGNQSPFAAGAIFANNMTAQVIHSSFVNNQAAGNGGAIGGFNASLELVGITASGNQSGQHGGAVHSRITDGNVARVTTIEGSTFVGNFAPIGADFVIRPNAGLDGNAELANSIFASSVAGTQAIVNTRSGTEPPGRIISHGSNLVVDDSIAGFNANDRNDTDALLGERTIASNGVHFHATLPGSPAHDAGDETRRSLDQFDVDGDGDRLEPIPFDSILGPRSVALDSDGVGGGVDIGAYEAQRDVVISAANGPIGVLMGQQNVVFTTVNGVILATASQDIDSITLRGSFANDALVLADLSGVDPAGNGSPWVIAVEGNGGTDSLVISGTYFDPANGIDDRLTLSGIGQVIQDTTFSHGVRLSPQTVRHALGESSSRLDWIVDHTAALSTVDDWRYAGHVFEDATFYRRFQADGIEVRMADVSPWTNPLNPVDVSAGDGVSPIDALLVINAIAQAFYFDPQTQELKHPVELGTFSDAFYDVNQDGKISPIDALFVINFIARQPAEGEDEADSDVVVSDFLKPNSPQIVDHVMERWMPPRLG
ncbi:choice-of-anchor Q domain-containing protein [Stieleria mannarensis]|uniref:choice-of-anchor Q domain-containing protein n=1 Tax=Stieleria mannarensis TaxID=2755585 RepID=UPI001603C32C|nr:choice-of-anchor Q domain-containing protein [Rhodopirellula sp. JC639]